ncbi:MAG: hypothetical protein K6F25_03315 [Bacteroidales bacterium]|nr:hypothetical protein [Bacteroidales bacterium]
MKILKFLAAAVVTLSLLSSCSVIKTVAASNPSQSGSYTGEALAALYQVLQQSGSIDLSSITNIVNLGRILTGAQSATRTGQAFVDTFTKNLISGSNRLINTSNVGNVISGLKALANVDTSAIGQAATKAVMTGVVPALSNSDPSVSATMGQLSSILGLLK